MTPIQRRNFLPTVIVDIILWILCGLIIIFLDPEKSPIVVYYLRFTVYPNIIFFFLVFTLSLTLALALLFANTRRGFFIAVFFVSLLVLKVNKYFSWKTAVIFFFALFFLELFLIARKRKKIRP